MSYLNNQNAQPIREDSFVLVSSHALKRLEEKIDSIHIHLQSGSPTSKGIHGHVSEKQAMEQFKKSHTWFWEQRRKGLLPHSKVGKTIYYLQSDLLNLLQSES